MNLKQQLGLAPQLQQAIQLLQLTSIELQRQVQEAIETNPFLEAISKQTQQPTANISSTNKTKSALSNDDFNLIELQSKQETLRDHLSWQAAFAGFNEIEHAIALTIIDAINDDGFLTSSLEDIQQSINSSDYIDLNIIKLVLAKIQNFEPAGVAARNSRECLLIQMNQLPTETPWLYEAQKIVEECLDLLANHDYQHLKKRYHMNDNELAKIMDLIKSLNPCPGSEFVSINQEYIIPDVFTHKIENQWHVFLNEETITNLTINQQYKHLIKQGKTPKDVEYMRQNLQQARWLIRSINKRNETLLKVATFIINKQQDFLNHGESAMHPLVIHEVSDALDLHDSTISRITNGKFIMTPQGVFELKFFFSSQLTTNSGKNCSSTAVRAIVKQLIEDENPQKPLSDNKITKLLANKGINVARRTIAKYREAMRILPSSKRKRLS